MQQNPIGLDGGMNLYFYVKDSNFQIDVFGWEDIVFRCLSQTDIKNINNGLGIIPKSPSASATVLEHVLYGSSDGYGDPFISFTRSERFTKNWTKNNGTAVVSVDLDTIHNPKIDLSTSEGRIAYLGDESKAVPDTPVHTANKFTKGAKEVLVEGEASNSKIKKGGSTGKVPCCG